MSPQEVQAFIDSTNLELGKRDQELCFNADTAYDIGVIKASQSLNLDGDLFLVHLMIPIAKRHQCHVTHPNPSNWALAITFEQFIVIVVVATVTVVISIGNCICLCRLFKRNRSGGASYLHHNVEMASLNPRTVTTTTTTTTLSQWVIQK